MEYEAKAIDGEDRPQLSGPEAPSRRRRKWIIAAAVLLLLLLVAWVAFGRGDEEGAAAAGAQPAGDSQVPTVSVMVPGRESIQAVVTGTGSLAARREMPIGVAGEGGEVTRVLVEPGSWVGQGQVLASVDRSVQAQTAESLQAQVRVARADARIAQSELDRSQQLLGRGFVSQADIDRKTATRDAAQARVRVAEAQLAETQARNRRLDIRAPAAGLVLTRSVEPGQIVSSGSGTLFRMAMGGQMEMRARLSETDVARVRVGVPAEVTPVGSTATFRGEVWQVSPVIDPDTRQGTVRIALSYDPALRPGGFATARILSGARAAPLLPESAVLSDGKGNYVYVLDDKNRAQRRAVTVGQVSDAGVAIADGLSGTERVVVSAGAFLNPGQKVNPTLRKTGR
ncbi:efflux RND transporter periplasmic adaptor subunit [Sphingomonas desiccabilis]|uniref:Efflux RND transporter periplasmic adaptor subunit n=1 Tax=Sphingomonas desiccabilis TaxID=429134 RepID=A0A4Q2IME7_9SPHN|nr:efflux RND transporter periplasmic adaptor subunit [Sphingomonas desiccabilis]MBB3912349.1 RND family efflux transporter MFP subunit [Sphingomonas desiccabilis]RXZ30490.1 efflux RND transporter periplasmic adaptor subunit [Sphingomonas desiccabilis]